MEASRLTLQPRQFHGSKAAWGQRRQGVYYSVCLTINRVSPSLPADLTGLDTHGLFALLFQGKT